MYLKDIRTEFTPAVQSSVSSNTLVSHTVCRGSLSGSTKTWIKKEMPKPAVARIELLAEEFFRLIIPHQPETHLLHNPSNGIYYILSEEVPGYRQLPNEPHNYANGRYKGLGQVLVGAVFLQEIDLKNGNVGLDNQGRVTKIDGDCCFAGGRFAGKKYDLTPAMIESLPYPFDFYAYNWLDLIQTEIHKYHSAIVSPALANAPRFRDEVNQAMLKICLLPESYIERFVDAFMPAGGQYYIDLITKRQAELQRSALQNPSFRTYLLSQQAEEDAKNLFAQMSLFIANGKTLVLPQPEQQTTENEVRIRFIDLLNVYSDPHKILDDILLHRLSEKDTITLDYAASMRTKLNSEQTEEELLTLQTNFIEILLSVTSHQVKAVQDVVQTLRNNNHWWTVGHEEKAKRIEQALLDTPLKDRGSVITAKGPANAVQEALASHRHWWHLGNVYKNKNMEIDVNKAATTFKTMNAGFFSESPKQDKEQERMDANNELKF